MAYVRKRPTYRRKGRRGSRTLSTRSIFSNKSARSQAKQISALTKRVRTVARKCAPEVKVVNPEMDNRGFGDAPRGLDYAMVQRLPFPSQGTDNQERIGDKIRLLPSEVFLTVQYEEIYESLRLGYSTVQIPITSSAIQHRVIFVQAKTTSQSLQVSTLSSILDQNYYATPPGPIEAQMSMKIPFAAGVTANWNILSDKIITVSRDNPQKAFRFKIRPKQRDMRWFDDGNGLVNGTPAGAIYMIVLTSGWSAFKYDVVGGDPYYDYNKTNFSWRFRQPFTDA